MIVEEIEACGMGGTAERLRAWIEKRKAFYDGAVAYCEWHRNLDARDSVTDVSDAPTLPIVELLKRWETLRDLYCAMKESE
jgi:hypothetical protein